MGAVSMAALRKEKVEEWHLGYGWKSGVGVHADMVDELEEWHLGYGWKGGCAAC